MAGCDWWGDHASSGARFGRASTRAFVDDETASAAESTVTGPASGASPGAIVEGGVDVVDMGGAGPLGAAGGEGGGRDGPRGSEAAEAESECDRRLREIDM